MHYHTKHTQNAPEGAEQAKERNIQKTRRTYPKATKRKDTPYKSKTKRLRPKSYPNRKKDYDYISTRRQLQRKET